MTVLNFLLTDEAVYLLTDTVLSDPDDLSPVTFTTKIHALPHLQALICGTGHAQAIAELGRHREHGAAGARRHPPRSVRANGAPQAFRAPSEGGRR